MSDLLKELQEAHRESPSWRLFGLCHQAATRIAALEAKLAERVKVKPLEWSDVRQPDEEIRYHHIIAESPIGQWTIQWKGWKDYDDRTVFLDGDFVLNGGDLLEAAKAAAQADFKRRILSALEATPPARADRLKDEPTAFLVERIAGSGYGRARKVIDAAIYDPRRDDFWIGDAKKNHLVTPLYAPSTLEATPPAPKVTEAMVEAGCKAFLAEYGDPSAEWHHYRREVTAALIAAMEYGQ